jgi:hypothetical protein
LETLVVGADGVLPGFEGFGWPALTFEEGSYAARGVKAFPGVWRLGKDGQPGLPGLGELAVSRVETGERCGPLSVETRVVPNLLCFLSEFVLFCLESQEGLEFGGSGGGYRRFSVESESPGEFRVGSSGVRDAAGLLEVAGLAEECFGALGSLGLGSGRIIG